MKRFLIVWTLLGLGNLAAEPYYLEHYIKARALKQTSRDFFELAHQVDFPKEKLAIAYMALGLLGYPSYPDLVDGENTCFLVFKGLDSDSRKQLIVAKLRKEALVRKAVGLLGWSIEEVDGWCILLKKGAKVEDYIPRDRLIRMVSNRPNVDVVSIYWPKEGEQGLYLRVQVEKDDVKVVAGGVEQEPALKLQALRSNLGVLSPLVRQYVRF